MALIQVKVIAGVFTAQQKQEIIERLTDAMVEVDGENMRRRTGALSRRSPAANGASAARPSPPTTSRRSRVVRSRGAARQSQFLRWLPS
jgi:4-oxalocrotonate tautomerase